MTPALVNIKAIVDNTTEWTDKLLIYFIQVIEIQA